MHSIFGLNMVYINLSSWVFSTIIKCSVWNVSLCLPSRCFVHPYSLLSLRSRRLKVLNGRCLPRAPRSFLSPLLLSDCYAGRTTVFLIWLTYQYLLERFHSTPVRDYHPDNSLEKLWRMVHQLAPAVQWRSCGEDSSYPYVSAVESWHFLAWEKSDL